MKFQSGMQCLSPRVSLHEIITDLGWYEQDSGRGGASPHVSMETLVLTTTLGLEYHKIYGSPGVQLRDFTSQVKQNNPRHWCTEGGKEPWLVRFSGLSAGLRTKGSPVLYPVRAHAWVASQVPSKGYMRGNLTLMFLSLSFSLSYLLSKTEKNLLKIKKVRSTVSLHPSHPTQGTEHRHVWEPIRKHSLTRHQDLLTQSSQFIRVPRWLVCTFWEALHYHTHRGPQMIFPVVVCVIYCLNEWCHASCVCPSKSFWYQNVLIWI